MDISAVVKKSAKVKEGEIIFSDAEKQANLNGTISYEVLTKWGMRAEKRYLR